MAVEIRILSGARRGERLYLDRSQFRIGSEPGCDVFFNPQVDPAARGRSALLNLTGDGWLLRPLGGALLVNHEPVVGEIRLRSGDLVRLSDAGPDFLFVITAHRTPAAEVIAAPAAVRVPATAAPGAVMAPAHASELVPPASSAPAIRSHRKWWIVGATLTAVLMIMVVTSLTGHRWPNRGQSARGVFELQIDRLASRSVDEETALSFRVRVHPPGPAGGLTFSLVGEPPEGVQLDPRSGEFTWTPAESQGPGKYPVTIRVSARADEEGSTETTFWIDVREINSAPRIAPPGEQLLDAGKETAFSVIAHDFDQPANQTTFRVVDGPEWLRIDPRSGLVRCLPPAGTDGPFEATLAAIDDGRPPLQCQQTVKLVVRGDAWAAVADRLRLATYLVQVEIAGANGTATWPFATAVAVEEHTLVSSAREVFQMAQWARQGHRLWLHNPSQGTKDAVDDLRVGREFVAAMGSEGDWIYSNIGLLRTPGKLSETIELPTARDLEELEEGLPVACFGYAHEGTKATRFDHFELGKYPSKIYLITRLPDLPAGSRLLEIRGNIPQNVYGSPVVNRQGALLGIYGARTEPGAEIKDLHYATAVTPELLDSWQEDSEAWVAPPVAMDQSASPSSPSGVP